MPLRDPKMRDLKHTEGQLTTVDSLPPLTFPLGPKVSGYFPISQVPATPPSEREPASLAILLHQRKQYVGASKNGKRFTQRQRLTRSYRTLVARSGEGARQQTSPNSFRAAMQVIVVAR